MPWDKWWKLNPDREDSWWAYALNGTLAHFNTPIEYSMHAVPDRTPSLKNANESITTPPPMEGSVYYDAATSPAEGVLPHLRRLEEGVYQFDDAKGQILREATLDTTADKDEWPEGKYACEDIKGVEFNQTLSPLNGIVFEDIIGNGKRMSVVVPCAADDVQLVPQLLWSVLEQTVKPKEVIFVVAERIMPKIAEIVRMGRLTTAQVFKKYTGDDDYVKIFGEEFCDNFADRYDQSFSEIADLKINEKPTPCFRLFYPAFLPPLEKVYKQAKEQFDIKFVTVSAPTKNETTSDASLDGHDELHVKRGMRKWTLTNVQYKSLTPPP